MAKVPVPELVQFTTDATVKVAFRFTRELLAQIFWAEPTARVTAGVMVTVKDFTTGLQVPFPVVVAVSVTVPAAISAADGMYLEFSDTLSGAKDPVPELVQLTPVATVMAAFNCT